MAQRPPSQKISDSMTGFSLELYKCTVQAKGGSSVFVSPSSVFAVLAMLHPGARNKTQAEMTSVMQLEKVELESLYESIGKSFGVLTKGSDFVTISSANKIFPCSKKDILETYTSLVQKYFGSTVKPMNFKKDPEGCRKEINLWVEEQTNQKIKDLLPAGSVTKETGMVVANAVYFKGEWASGFEECFTRKKDFNKIKSSKVQVNMMTNESIDVGHAYNTNEGYQLLEMFYEGCEYGMIILLPNEIEGLRDLEAKLTLYNLRATMNKASRKTVTVNLPKFRLESELALKPLLNDLGIVDAFNPAAADFTGIGKKLFVSEVFHKTFVDVNESGTEAAAASVMAVIESCAPMEKEIVFTADHPFMFMMWDHRINAPIFMGRYMGPA